LSPGLVSGSGWAITEVKKSGNMMSGSLTVSAAGWCATPVLYLNASAVISDVGDGSSASPYRIVVNE